MNRFFSKLESAYSFHQYPFVSFLCFSSRIFWFHNSRSSGSGANDYVSEKKKTGKRFWLEKGVFAQVRIEIIEVFRSLNFLKNTEQQRNKTTFITLSYRLHPLLLFSYKVNDQSPFGLRIEHQLFLFGNSGTGLFQL